MTAPYREAPILEHCSACDQRSIAPCTCCGLPTCAGHARPSTRCAACDANLAAAEGEVRLFHRSAGADLVAVLAGYVGLMTIEFMPLFGAAAFAASGLSVAAGRILLKRRIAEARNAVTPKR